MRRKSLTLLVVIVTLAIGSLLNAPAAYSASWYDGKILSTQRLEVLSVEGTTDLTTDWRKVFRGILDRRSGDPSADEMLAQFNANQFSGTGWLVQSVYQGMRVITFDPDATITFDDNWNGYLHLMFSTGRVCVWETGGHSWKNWRDLDASPRLEGYVSVECSSYDTVNPSYVQYDIGLTAPAFRMPYLFIASGNIQYPAGYEGVPIRTTEPGAKYVAMGDSYSSGEGNPPFEIGTDVGGASENRCHRSSQAYPRLLQSSLNLGSMDFVACSGATTADVLGNRSGPGNWNEGAQVGALSADTEVVTVTIGGNDAGFQEYLFGCISICGPTTITYDAMMSLINSPSFLSNLETTYEEILDRASSANVYVIDYPYVAADNAGICNALDFSGARDIQVALNASIAQAVVNVRGISTDYSSRLRYVSTNATGSPFEGKHLCNGGASDFGSTTFHPNTQGHLHYEEVVISAIN